MSVTSKALAGRRIALCVTGGIAAYKSVALARLLIGAGAEVTPLMTKAAQHFVGKTTLSGICGRAVLDDLWDPRFSGEAHVAIADAVDAIVVAPTTADFLARFAEGRADDVVSALALVAKCPLLLAPAMHPRMWAHPATRRNVATLLADDRASFVGPEHGPVASGDVGLGRMTEPEGIVAALVERLGAHGDLRGRHVVVTAGPTVEDLDPVRFIGNRSTGKMGFAIAEAAAARGARVTLIAGPVGLPTPPRVDRLDVRSALEMQAALDGAVGATLDGADAVLMAAAVADYRPAERSTDKQKKGADELVVRLVKNPDLIAELGARRDARSTPVLVAFAVETRELAEAARKKLASKRVDMVVANLAEHGFGGDDDQGLIVDARGETPFSGSKRAIADTLLDLVAAKIGGAR